MKKKPRYFNKLMLGVSFALTALTLPCISQAGIQDELDSFFGDMSNVTAPGVYETQTRGVFAGGRYTTKSRIFDEQLISFAPPSWKGGCGGIDMFGGSFSFISADQIVQLLRQVAANAKGYAFQLALDNVCPDCSKHIESFQKKIQELNQHLGNSCQMAQGFINDATSSFDLKGRTDASLASTVTGLASDMFSAREQVETAKSPEEDLGEEELLRRELMGNIVWQQLQKQNVRSWFRYGDIDLLETMMSLTGTLVREAPTADPNHSGGGTDADSTLPLKTYPPKVDLLQALLNGGSVNLYSCTERTNCLEPGESTLVITGLGKMVEDMLIGTGSSPGIIYKFANNTGNLNAQEQAFMASLPSGTGTIVRNLSVLSEDSAHIFAIRASKSIALSMVYTTSEELLRAVALAVSQSKSPYQGEAYKFIESSQRRIRGDFDQLRSEHGDISELVDYYNGLLSNLRKNRYTLSTLTTPRRTVEQ